MMENDELKYTTKMCSLHPKKHTKWTHVECEALNCSINH